MRHLSHRHQLGAQRLLALAALAVLGVLGAFFLGGLPVIQAEPTGRPAWCVDDGQVAIDAAIADRITLIQRYSPGLPVDRLTVKAALMAECSLPASLQPISGGR